MNDRLNLHAELKRGAFDFAFLTTYEFDVPFFESFALEKFDSLATNAGIVVFTDDRTHEKLISAPAGRSPKLAGLRYVVSPIRCGGVFHPKIFLFASATRGLLVIGSANLTRAGLGRNAELVTALRFEAGKREEHLPLFQDAFRFFGAVTNRWSSPTVVETYRELRATCPWLVGEADDARDVRLVHNLDTPIWGQLVDILGSPPDRVDVLSPYFDAEPKILDEISSGEAKTAVMLQTERGGTTMTQRWLEHRRVMADDVKIFVTNYSDGEHPQRLHGKAILLRAGSRGVLTFGSANFTQAALLRNEESGNIEANLIIVDAGRVVPESLFDPLGRRRPARAEDLPEQGEADFVGRGGVDLRVLEVRLEEDGLVAVLGSPVKGKPRASAHLSIEGRKAVVVSLRWRDGSTTLDGPVTDEIRRAVTEASATVQLELDVDGEDTLRSNRLFLLNLQDPPTGGRRQQHRRLREANQSAAQFADVLAELLDGEDDEALLRFLALCDIKIAQAGRVGLGRSSRDAWEPGGARVLGSRNVRLFFTIHEAALEFTDRHLRRLSRHTNRATISSVPAALHVVRAIAEVARAQLDRLATGLEAARSPLSPEVWGKCRTQAGQYISRLEECMRILHDDYLPALRHDGRDAELRAALQPDLAPLTSIVSGAFAVKERLDAANLRVRTPHGTVSAPYFARDILNPARLSTIEAGVRSRLSSLV